MTGYPIPLAIQDALVQMLVNHNFMTPDANTKIRAQILEIVATYDIDPSILQDIDDSIPGAKQMHDDAKREREMATRNDEINMAIMNDGEIKTRIGTLLAEYEEGITRTPQISTERMENLADQVLRLGMHNDLSEETVADIGAIIPWVANTIRNLYNERAEKAKAVNLCNFGQYLHPAHYNITALHSNGEIRFVIPRCINHFNGTIVNMRALFIAEKNQSLHETILPTIEISFVE